jgi:hypothetical protein
MSDYPEHEKLEAVAETSQKIGDFLEEMNQREGWSLCVWSEQYEERLHWPHRRRSTYFHTEPDPVIQGPPDLRRHDLRDEWLPVRGSISDKLARFFGIDLDVLEAEKRAMLVAIRALH